MTDTTIAPFITHTAALVQVLHDEQANPTNRCLIYTPEGIRKAWTWLDLSTAPNSLHLGLASIMPICVDELVNVLVGFAPNLNSPLAKVIPDSLCPVPGLVEQVSRLLDAIAIPPLREFALRALLANPALPHYWCCPASRQDHHAFQGGLVYHSVEVAKGVQATSWLPQLERELGIVYALLHDYGKPWCLEPALRDRHERRNHECIGRAKLHGPLQILRQQDALLAALMDELLGGPPAPRPTSYPLAIRRLVQALDQASCENTRGLFSELRGAYTMDAIF